MPKEQIDFGLISGYNTPNGVGLPKQPIAQNYDHSFANWLVAVRSNTPHNAKLASYRMRTLTKGAYPHTKGGAEALGASIDMSNED